MLLGTTATARLQPLAAAAHTCRRSAPDRSITCDTAAMHQCRRHCGSLWYTWRWGSWRQHVPAWPRAGCWAGSGGGSARVGPRCLTWTRACWRASTRWAASGLPVLQSVCFAFQVLSASSYVHVGAAERRACQYLSPSLAQVCELPLCKVLLCDDVQYPCWCVGSKWRAI